MTDLPDIPSPFSKGYVYRRLGKLTSYCLGASPRHDLASRLPVEAPQDPAADRLTGAHVVRPRSHYVVAAVLVALALWGVILTVGWLVLA